MESTITIPESRYNALIEQNKFLEQRVDSMVEELRELREAGREAGIRKRVTDDLTAAFKLFNDELAKSLGTDQRDGSYREMDSARVLAEMLYDANGMKLSEQAARLEYVVHITSGYKEAVGRLVKEFIGDRR